MARSARQAVGWLALAAAVYTAALLVRYFVSHGPRFQVESAFFIFVALGVMAVLLRPDDHADPVRPGRVPKAAGAMFAVFPGLSEAVVWASGAQDVLMTTLALAAVALATAGKPRVVPAVLASAAALLVKETAVVVPALAALVVLSRGGATRPADI